jgi:hypothetical protein
MNQARLTNTPGGAYISAFKYTHLNKMQSEVYEVVSLTMTYSVSELILQAYGSDENLVVSCE